MRTSCQGLLPPRWLAVLRVSLRSTRPPRTARAGSSRIRQDETMGGVVFTSDANGKEARSRVARRTERPGALLYRWPLRRTGIVGSREAAESRRTSSIQRQYFFVQLSLIEYQSIESVIEQIRRDLRDFASPRDPASYPPSRFWESGRTAWWPRAIPPGQGVTTPEFGANLNPCLPLPTSGAACPVTC